MGDKGAVEGMVPRGMLGKLTEGKQEGTYLDATLKRGKTNKTFAASSLTITLLSHHCSFDTSINRIITRDSGS